MASWPRKFQTCGHFDPLPTGHVTRSMRSKLLAFNLAGNVEALYLYNSARLMHGHH